MPTILYIAGYSRSGSTILDMLLGAHPEAVSTGELTFLLEDSRNPDRVCTCGEPYAQCSFWGAWVEQHLPSKNEAEILRKIEHREYFSTLLKGNVPKDIAAAYAKYATELMSHIKQSVSASVIVDSSKTALYAAGRPLAQRKIAGLDVRVLHLTRSPQATVRSYIDTGSNWAAEGIHKRKSFESWRPIFGWTYANSIASQIGAAIGKDRYLHVRYENLMRDPAAEMEQIGAFAGLDLTDVTKAALAGETFSASHNVGGNRTRLEPQAIRFGGTSKPPKLPLGHSIALRALASREMRRLGYS